MHNQKKNGKWLANVTWKQGDKGSSSQPLTVTRGGDLRICQRQQHDAATGEMMARAREALNNNAL